MTLHLIKCSRFLLLFACLYNVLFLLYRCLQEIRHDNYVEAFKCQFSLIQYPFYLECHQRVFNIFYYICLKF